MESDNDSPQEWYSRVRTAFLQEEQELVRLKGEADQLSTWAQVLDGQAKKIAHRIETRTENLRSNLDALELMRHDPVVLVRNYGTPVVYHSAEHPCGWVRDPSSGYERLLWGEAQKRGLASCTSCGYVADRDAQARRPKPPTPSPS